jgi:hypothetical protein
MAQPLRRVIRSLHRQRHFVLMLSLMLLIIGWPFFQDFGRGVLNAMLIVALLTSMYASASRRYERWIGSGLMAIILYYSTIPHDPAKLSTSLTAPILALLFFMYVVYLLMRWIFTHSASVTKETIVAAVSAYLLIGLVWAQAYAILSVFEPGSFDFTSVTFDQSHQDFDRYIGFSFITLTTLGYGNTVPTTPRATSLAVTEAIVGQLYVAVLLARLVAMELTTRRNGPDARDGPTAP